VDPFPLCARSGARFDLHQIIVGTEVSGRPREECFERWGRGVDVSSPGRDEVGGRVGAHNADILTPQGLTKPRPERVATGTILNADLRGMVGIYRSEQWLARQTGPGEIDYPAIGLSCSPAIVGGLRRQKAGEPGVDPAKRPVWWNEMERAFCPDTHGRMFSSSSAFLSAMELPAYISSSGSTPSSAKPSNV